MKYIDQLNKFNYSKKGIIIGLVMGILVSIIGGSSLYHKIGTEDSSSIFKAICVLVLGLSTVGMEFYRAVKLKSMSK